MHNILLKWLVPEPVYYNVFRDKDLKPDIDTLNLKDMQFGASQNAIDPGAIQDAQLAPVFLPNAGMILSAVTTGAADVSKTVYIVTSELAKLETPVHLRVEVLFDLPESTVDSGTWGLVVNLKRGTAVDAGIDVDTPVGPNCQFNPQKKLPMTGVRLTGTEAENDFLDNRPYDQYRTDSTLFGLRADLTHTGLNYGGPASLVLSDQSGLKAQPGTLIKQDFSDPSIEQMAIGIGLVNQGGDAKTVSVRLLSFAIWTRPITIEVEHLLLKQHAGPDPQVIVSLQRTEI